MSRACGHLWPWSLVAVGGVRRLDRRTEPSNAAYTTHAAKVAVIASAASVERLAERLFAGRLTPACLPTTPTSTTSRRAR